MKSGSDSEQFKWSMGGGALKKEGRLISRHRAGPDIGRCVPGLSQCIMDYGSLHENLCNFIRFCDDCIGGAFHLADDRQDWKYYFLSYVVWNYYFSSLFLWSQK